MPACPYCQEEIREKVVVCPHCQTDLTNPGIGRWTARQFTHHPWRMTVIAVVLGLSAIVVWFGAEALVVEETCVALGESRDVAFGARAGDEEISVFPCGSVSYGACTLGLNAEYDGGFWTTISSLEAGLPTGIAYQAFATQRGERFDPARFTPVALAAACNTTDGEVVEFRIDF